MTISHLLPLKTLLSPKMKKINYPKGLKQEREIEYKNVSDSENGITKSLLEKYRPKQDFYRFKVSRNKGVLRDIA